MSVDTARNPYVFVVGCLRSGTTMLQRMLDSHPQLAVGYDCHFIPSAVRRVPRGVDPALTGELVARVRAMPRFARLGLADDVPDQVAKNARTYSEFVSGIYTEFGRLHGKPLAGEKAPGYCRHIPRLHGLFPRVRFIHLIRDGREIALSVRDWGKGPAKLDLAKDEPIGAAALWWRRDVLAGLTEGRKLDPSRYLEVRYDSLVADPRGQLERIAAFLDLPFAEQMVTYYEGKIEVRPGRSAKASWIAPTSGLRDWRTQMSTRDVELFEAIAGDVLTTLGYERTTERPSPAILEIADRCRDWWRRNMSGPGDGDDRDAPPARSRRTKDQPPVVVTVPAAGAAGAVTNPFVFIVGCPRSGTTLLKRIVDAHPLIAITPETHWVPRFPRKQIGVTGDGFVTNELVPSLLAYHKFGNLRISPDELQRIARENAGGTYAGFVSRVFDLYGRHQGKQLVGDKTPGYVQDMPLLNELWPAAKFVHLVRDGRDVCLSMLDWNRAYRTAGRLETWADDPISTTAFWWERFVRLGIEAGRALGPDLYHEIRYESIVANPREQCEKLCAFLGVAYDESMVQFHEGRTRDDPALSAKKAWRPVTPGMRDWRSQMPPETVERFEAAAGTLLDELGYATACDRLPAEAIEHAEAMRRRYTADPRLRNRRVPVQRQPVGT